MDEPIIQYADLAEEDLASLPPTFFELSSVVGGDGALQICMKLGGSGFYFPKLDDLLRSIRNRKIKEDFDGANYRELVLKYNLSESYIRKILRPGYDDQQGDLF